MPLSTLLPPPHGVALRDGSRVVIRPIDSGDRDALGAAFERLGEQSRYRRFLTATPTLADWQLRYLTEVDQHDHVALAAVDAADGSSIVGVARSVRLDGSDAEPALTVVDSWQGRGLGSVLLAALVARSRPAGVTRYRAQVLSENEAMLRLLAGVGQMRFSTAGSALEVTVELR